MILADQNDIKVNGQGQIKQNHMISFDIVLFLQVTQGNIPSILSKQKCIKHEKKIIRRKDL